jgi:hypothetical protein
VAWVLVCATPWQTLQAHELTETSATLVIRDGGHLSLRLQVPWATVLQARLAPGRPAVELLGQLAAEPAPTFARRYSAVIALIARDTHALDPQGRPVAFVHWQWPSAAQVQEALRRELMARLADPVNFAHQSRLAATAEVTLQARASGQARLRLPTLLGPALLTITRPREEWLRGGAPSAPFALRD